MKTYLSIAALLAAGTLVSNASVVLTLDADALAKANGTYSLVDNSLAFGSGYGNFSVTVVLDVTVLSEKLSSKDVAESIFSVTGSGTKSMGAGVNYVTTTTPSTSGLYGSWDTKISYSFEDSISTALVATLGSGTYSSAALSVSYTGAGAKAYLTLVDSTGEETTLTGTNTTLKFSDFGRVNSLTFNTDYVEYLQVHDSYYEHSVGTYETVNSSAIQAASIPEPSAFGLLAGLGALALVASRRRRTKRA